jgi:deoxyribodipyrimidine photo-lyase
MQPLILWFRRDLRLDDNPMLAEAAQTGRPLIPVFIADDSVTGLGAAARWRLGEGLKVFAETLKARGSRLILRKGRALDTLRDLAKEADAAGVWWGRLYDAPARARDTEVKKALREGGIAAQSFSGHTLIEPWQVATGEGGHYKVYTPFWKALSAHGVAEPCKAPSRLPAPGTWPASDSLDDWKLGAAMNRGAEIVAHHARIGTDAAEARLDAFLDGPVEDYRTARDFPGRAATSRLSENLTLGEIGPRRVWWRVQRLLEQERGHRGAEHFLKELAWRDFAHHLIFHTPEIATGNWRAEWDAFPWRDDNDDAERWRRGLTGEPLVDAGMREMYVTGTMHNRARMIVASYLTKHLMTHWKVGLAWFEACLIDWDPASNALGWQWVAGSGPDAAPYFRVFNPATQAEKFDPDESYRRRFVAELTDAPGEDARAWFDAVPRSWKLDPEAAYPEPMIDLKAGRQRALDAYERHRSG